jgi:hypothetical protein
MNFYKLLDLAAICNTSMIHTFHTFKKIIYEHIECWNTHTPCGAQTFKFLYTLCICFVVHGFLIKCNNTQIVYKNYKCWHVIKLHYTNVSKKVSLRNSIVISKVIDLVLTWVCTFLLMFNYFKIQHDIIPNFILFNWFSYMSYILLVYYEIYIYIYCLFISDCKYFADFWKMINKGLVKKNTI